MTCPGRCMSAPDHEGNLILDLAAEVGAMLLMSNDTDLLAMSPRRGTPILTPTAFVGKVDAVRCHTQRRPRRGRQSRRDKEFDTA
jgi:hypothetical protein